jgi:TrmH family RNA methyltransferase
MTRGSLEMNDQVEPVPLSKRMESLLRGLARRHVRMERRALVADGIRVVDEALSGAMRVTDLVVTPDVRPVVERWRESGRLSGINVWLVDSRRFAALVDTEHPQGVLAVVEMPRTALDRVGAHGPILLLDRLQDPGNAGTLLRTLLAVGGRTAVALRETVDLFNPKVVRAGAGSLFHLDVVADVSLEDVRAWLAERSAPLLALDPRGESIFDIADPVPASYVLAIGNEAAGVSEALLRTAERRVAIPMQPPTESLNAGVAGSIALYELWRRQMAASHMTSPPGARRAPLPDCDT